MDLRRAHLKELAARCGSVWADSPVPACLAGETRLETRNTVYRLHDGVVVATEPGPAAKLGRAHPAAFVGMRVVGWLATSDPTTPCADEWTPGAFAVLWRPHADELDRTAVALTSSSVALRVTRRSPAPGAVRALRSVAPLSAPPRPPTPVPPPPESTTRLHDPDERVVEISTQLRTSAVPPPPPSRGRVALRHMPLRAS